MVDAKDAVPGLKTANYASKSAGGLREGGARGNVRAAGYGLATAASMKPGMSALAPVIAKTTDVVADRMGPTNNQGMPNLHGKASPAAAMPMLPHLQKARSAPVAPGMNLNANADARPGQAPSSSISAMPSPMMGGRR